ncbi:MAG: hypothetical protein PHS32_08475 [Rhodoferax sp.]|uniref:hypothetical protein n=1 Tax=Rhodoferax sp. TaxID=50421 RepID=UPI0026368151|nr:hypothetical protein [Rhodoferax sp.]MDD5333768.1 hypothetical protein [Rhodoferax sp.]
MGFLKRLSRLSIATLVSLLAACGGGSTAPVSPQEQYAAAVADASVALPSEISRFLTPINAQNPDLVWENGVVGSRLLVVSWLDDAGKYYQCNLSGGCGGNTACLEGGECPTYKYDSWVTVVPELKNFFAGKAPEPLRMAQLLGLPPEGALAGNPKGYKYLLEMWVSPLDLFRPCPDTEISDTVCELGFPADAFRTPVLSNLVRATDGPNYGVFMTYPDWFNNRTRYVYTMDANPYPWTRLGYTYDWGSSNHIGLSEFVLHGRKADGTTISVGIKSVKTTAQYFLP